MIKKLASIAVVVAFIVLGVPFPVHASDYDYAVSVTATANSTTVPSVITWEVTVSSTGDEMGQFAVQEGYVEFTVPTSVSLVLSDDCDTDGNDVSCYWNVTDTQDATFEVHGLVSLLAVGSITVTPTITSSSPRTDVVSANDSDSFSCTAVTSALVTCP